MVDENKWKTRQLLYLSEQVEQAAVAPLRTELLDCNACGAEGDLITVDLQTSGDEPNKLTILMADVVKVRSRTPA